MTHDSTVQQVSKVNDSTAGYRNRMEIVSDSGNKYIIAQRTTDFTWCCSCRGWTTHRKCRHLTALGLMPGNTTPAEIVVERIGGLRWKVQQLRDAGTLSDRATKAKQPQSPKARTAPTPAPSPIRTGSGSNLPSKPLKSSTGTKTPVPAFRSSTANVGANTGHNNGLVRSLTLRSVEKELDEALTTASSRHGLTRAEIALILIRVGAKLT